MKLMDISGSIPPPTEMLYEALSKCIVMCLLKFIIGKTFVYFICMPIVIE